MRLIKSTCFVTILCFIILNCNSTKISLEKGNIINVNKATYSSWSSGVKGGGAGFNIRIEVDNNDVKKKLIGVFFREKYSNLKYSKPNIYSAFIRTKARDFSNKDIMEGLEIQKPTVKDKVETHKLPFTIEKNEAVLKCLVNDRIKYFKIILQKKSIDVAQ